MSKRISDIKNYYFPTVGTASNTSTSSGEPDVKKNLSRYITPVQFQRFRHDVKMWREAIIEAEHAYYPHRVKIQRLLQDTVLNGHVSACMERRKDWTLLRDFKICDDKGKEDEELKKLFRNISSTVDGDVNSASWFDDLMNYALDAKFFGYTLVSLGDVINDAYPELSLIRRQNISPDRLNVAAYIYSLSGQKFLEEPFKDWHIWVPTPSELGVSSCGWGILYKVAPYELMLRNNMAFNADFNEVFNQPLRKGRTTKTDESERAEFESAYILLDEGQDEVDFVESKNVGTAFQSYGNFEERLQKVISKLMLGHADAMDSVPGKLGNQGGKDNPVEQTKNDIQTKDGIFIQNIINTKLLPRMRMHGFNIPINYHFEFLNDKEKQEIREKEDQSNSTTADIALKMSQAGLQMDPSYFTERTGIPTTLKPDPATAPVASPNQPIE